jgi:hypothetical protein
LAANDEKWQNKIQKNFNSVGNQNLENEDNNLVS